MLQVLINNDVKQHIGLILKNARIVKKISQEDVAKFMNLSRASITNIEAGRHMPTFQDMYKLCCLYDIEPNDLFPKIVPYNIEFINESYVVTKTKKKIQIS